MGLDMKDTEYLNLIKETFPEVSIQDFSILGNGKCGTACLVNKNVIFKISNTDEKSYHDTFKEHNALSKMPDKTPFEYPHVVYSGRKNGDRFLFGESLISGITYSQELHDSFDESTKINILQQIGHLMRNLHSINITNEDGVLFVSDYTTAIEAFNKYYTDKVRACFSATDQEKIQQLCERYRYLSVNHPVKNVLVHADIHFGNLMFNKESKQFTGLLDFGAAHLAEPARDMHYYYGDGIKNILIGYGDNGDPFLPERQKFMSAVNFLANIDEELNTNESADSDIKKLLSIFK